MATASISHRIALPIKCASLLTLAWLTHCLAFVPILSRWSISGKPLTSFRTFKVAVRENDVSERAVQEDQLFEWLASNFGVVNKSTSLGGEQRGLIAEQDVQEGEVMLEIPSSLCLWSSRDGVINGLYGQTELCWEVAGDLRMPVSDKDFARGLTWDVRLAVALLEATADPQVGGQFWDLYGRLLPPPHTVSVPFCLPERLLVQLHNGGMAAGARRQKKRLRALYPRLMQTLVSHPKTAAYCVSVSGGVGSSGATSGEAGVVGVEDAGIPMALEWAFAMVRSRAFSAGDNEHFAFVPFLDMANHDFNPNADFSYEPPGVFRMRALRNISAGEEATISYGDKLDADRLMTQYGFSPPRTHPISHPLADLEARRVKGAFPKQPQPPQKEEVGGGKGAGARSEKEGDRAVVEGGGKIGMLEVFGEGPTSNVEKMRRMLMDELFVSAQDAFAQSSTGEGGSGEYEFELKVRQVLPIIPDLARHILEGDGKGWGEGEGKEEGRLREGAREVLEELEAYCAASFPTTDSQDEELLEFCKGKGKGTVDRRLVDVVSYRIGRKAAHSLAVDMLKEFLSSE